MFKTAIFFATLACSAVGAQSAAPAHPATSPMQRVVRGQTIVSRTLPAATFVIDSSYRYVGGQVVNLYGNADAEQHVFVAGGRSGPVERFVWIQFEHFLPSNNYRYDYKADRTTEIGALSFIYDVKSWTDYTVTADDPRSDGAAVATLLGKQGLAFPKRAARVRMFHLPTPDRRTELLL